MKQASIFTPDEESLLWESGVIGNHNPLALLRAVFFYNGKTFCLRGGMEQRHLKRSQFVRSHDPDCYTYVENGSKNHSGINTKEANKIVPVFACPEAKPHCLVYLLDVYFEKWPKQAVERDFFYLRPKKNPSESVWYDCSPVGRDTLKRFTEKMCVEAGISSKKTNHSLRATGASALFNAGVPEKLIRDVTGHHSNVLEVYQRPSVEQRQKVSKVLVQGAKEFSSSDKENVSVSASSTPLVPGPSTSQAARLPGSTVMGSMFNNCTVTISPQNFIINNYVGKQETEVDVDALLRGIDLNELLPFD